MKSRNLFSNLYSLFWGLYGQHAWDEQREPAQVSEPPERIAELLKQRQHNPGEWVLDAGCGTGNYALAVARAGFHVLGIDFAAGMLSKARTKVTGEVAQRISFRQADLTRPLEIPETRFDHILSISVLQTVADPQFTLGELRRVLKPGGSLVLSLPKQNSVSVSQSVWEMIRFRLRYLTRRTPGKILLVILKSFADRYGNSPRWNPADAQHMVGSAGFKLVSLEEGRQILLVAEKPTLRK